MPLVAASAGALAQLAQSAFSAREFKRTLAVPLLVGLLAAPRAHEHATLIEAACALPQLHSAQRRTHMCAGQGILCGACACPFCAIWVCVLGFATAVCTVSVECINGSLKPFPIGSRQCKLTCVTADPRCAG